MKHCDNLTRLHFFAAGGSAIVREETKARCLWRFPYPSSKEVQAGQRRGIDQRGQTVVALLVFMMMAIMLTMAATVIMAINTRANNSFIDGEQARQNAEAGVENAMQRLLRDSAYTGETMTLPDGTATISVSGSGTRTIVSQGANGNAHRTITATVTVTGTVMTLNSWSETP